MLMNESTPLHILLHITANEGKHIQKNVTTYMFAHLPLPQTEQSVVLIVTTINKLCT
jgi:hypothetical protein